MDKATTENVDPLVEQRDRHRRLLALALTLVPSEDVDWLVSGLIIPDPDAERVLRDEIDKTSSSAGVKRLQKVLDSDAAKAARAALASVRSQHVRGDALGMNESLIALSEGADEPLPGPKEEPTKSILEFVAAATAADRLSADLAGNVGDDAAS